MKWFMHQAAASHDSKLKKVLMHYGAEGYGLYWYCLEQICGAVDPKLTFELEHDSEILAHDLKIDTLKVQEMMNYMITIDLFSSVDGHVFCLKLAKYLGDKNTRNQKLRGIIQDQRDPNNGNSSPTVPDSPRLSALEERRGEEIRGEYKNKSTSETSVSNPVPLQKIIDLYHEKLPELPQCRKLTKTRKGLIQQRWREGDLPDLETWGEYFEYVRRSDFLMGRIDGRDGRPPFRADLEWLSRPTNYAKVFEGKYHGV